MKKEKSCGAIIYKYVGNELYILLLHHNLGHWSFAKGHMENNEIEVETALREIKEETNLDVELNTNFRYVETYSPKEGVIKDVVYFAAKYISGNVVPQLKEISEIKWILSTEVINLITHEDDKNMITAAISFIKSIK